MHALCFFMAGHERLKGRNQKVRLEPTTGAGDAGGRTREGGDLPPGPACHTAERGFFWLFGAIHVR